MSITDNLMPGLLLLQGTHKLTSRYILEPIIGTPVPEFVYRLTYWGFEPLYELV